MKLEVICFQPGERPSPHPELTELDFHYSCNLVGNFLIAVQITDTMITFQTWGNPI